MTPEDRLEIIELILATALEQVDMRDERIALDDLVDAIGLARTAITAPITEVLKAAVTNRMVE